MEEKKNQKIAILGNGRLSMLSSVAMMLAMMDESYKPNDLLEIEREYEYSSKIMDEYELIKAKKSRLSRNQREIIEAKALRILAKRKQPLPEPPPDTPGDRPNRS
jgi:hypothetical protein